MITNKSNIDKRIMSNKDQINYPMNNQNGLTHKSQQVLHQQNKASNTYNKNLNYNNYYSNQTSNQQNQKYNNKKKYNNYQNGNNGHFKNYNQNYNSLNRNQKNYRHSNQTGYNNNAELKYDSTGNSINSPPIVSSNSSSTNTVSPPSNLESPKSDSLNSLNNGANSISNNLKTNKEELNQDSIDNSKIKKDSSSVNVQVGNSCINKDDETQKDINKKVDNETQITNESIVVTSNSNNANNLARDLNNLQITNSSSKPLMANKTATSFKNNNNQTYHTNANRNNRSPYNQDHNSNGITSNIKNDKHNYDKPQHQTSIAPVTSSNSSYFTNTRQFTQSNGKTFNSSYTVANYPNNNNYNQSTNNNFKSYNRNKKATFTNHLLNNKSQYPATNQSNVSNSLLNKNQPSKLLMNSAINGANNPNHGNLSISQNQAIVQPMVPQNSFYYSTYMQPNQLQQNLNQSHNQHSHHLMPNQHPYSQNCVQCATYVTGQNAYPQFVQPNAYPYHQQYVALPPTAAYAYNQNLATLNTSEDIQQQQQTANAASINYRNENNSIKPNAPQLDQASQQANNSAILNQTNHPQNANVINVQNHPQIRQLNNNYQMHYQSSKFNVNQQQLNNQQEMMANYLQQFTYNNTYLGFPPANYPPQYLQSVTNESQFQMMTNSVTNLHPHTLHQQHAMNQYAINQSGQLQEQYNADQALATIAAADSTTRSNSVNYDSNAAGGNLIMANVAHQQNSIHQYHHEQMKFYPANYQPVINSSGMDYNNLWQQQQQQQQKANQIFNNGNTNEELNISSHNMASNVNYQQQVQQTDSNKATTPATTEQLNNNNNSINADSTVDKSKC